MFLLTQGLPSQRWTLFLLYTDIVLVSFLPLSSGTRCVGTFTPKPSLKSLRKSYAVFQGRLDFHLKI